MNNIKKYKLEIIVFISGAIVMILEMAGSRVMAPYLGTSLFVWTGLISVIMGSLSVGYYWGGKIADKGASYRSLSLILLFSGFSVLVVNMIKGALLSIIQLTVMDLRISSIWGGFLLFAVPSVLLGMVSPYAVKLKLESLKTSGVTVGSLYAISTAGSIFGTLLAGFFLISYFGTTNILFILAASLVLLSLFAHVGGDIKKKFSFFLLLGGMLYISYRVKVYDISQNFVDVDTDYNRVLIYSDKDFESTRPVRRMNLGNQYASAMYLDSPGMVYPYEKFYNLAPFFKPNIENSLIIGGAAYSFPKDYLAKYPGAKIDVVEIDPGLTYLAKKYFGLVDNSNMTIYHEDGRTYLNRNQKKYDAIFMDVFNTEVSLPFHLTTKETVEKIYNSLNDGGVMIMNLISSLDGPKSGFLSSEYYTYKEFFPQLFLFPVTTYDSMERQNLILIAYKSTKKLDFKSSNPEYYSELSRLWTGDIKSNGIILTDDFSPIERFYSNRF